MQRHAKNAGGNHRCEARSGTGGAQATENGLKTNLQPHATASLEKPSRILGLNRRFTFPPLRSPRWDTATSF
jgi:hypothetical protein